MWIRFYPAVSASGCRSVYLHYLTTFFFYVEFIDILFDFVYSKYLYKLTKNIKIHSFRLLCNFYIGVLYLLPIK